MEIAIVFLPLIAAAVAGLFGSFLGHRASQAITCIAVTVAAGLASILLLWAGPEIRVIPLWSWIVSGELSVGWALRIDPLTLVMMFVVTTVSAAVHWYSIGYMEHDPHKPRFMAYLSLFTFFMLGLVTSDNFLQMYFGWEGVGLCSYLLINFWYHKPSANHASIKAFLVNRIGDFGFALGIMGVYLIFRSLSFETVFALAPEKAHTVLSFLGMDVHALTLVCLLLFMGAMGKSAQLGLHVWLPDAMEGPTPVSALIHAATMVTAGIFLVARVSPLFEFAPIALDTILVIGGLTAFMAATIALTQFDIKRVIAYSTMSQLGYMFCAAGISAYQVAIFHLYTHAFFKALLFLGAGAVIHAFAGEQDMRKMGGVWKRIPITYSLMWIGSLALAGVPFLSGFYSKEAILEVVYTAPSTAGFIAYFLCLVTVFLTAFYSWRLIFLTFHRTPPETLGEVHEPPKIMLFPLIFLALGSIFAGVLGYRTLVETPSFWGNAIVSENLWLEEIHHLSWLVKGSPLILTLSGILAAVGFYLYRQKLPDTCARAFPRLYQASFNKWYFDRVYEQILVTPVKTLAGVLWKKGDGYLIDQRGVDALGASILRLARRASQLQSGYLFHYAFAMVAGVFLFVSWFYFYLG